MKRKIFMGMIVILLLCLGLVLLKITIIKAYGQAILQQFLPMVANDRRPGPNAAPTPTNTGLDPVVHPDPTVTPTPTKNTCSKCRPYDGPDIKHLFTK